MLANLLESLERSGVICCPSGERCVADVPWEAHPAFEGVALRHLVTAADTDGALSVHVVRIDPGCALASHRHDTQMELHEAAVGGTSK